MEAKEKILIPPKRRTSLTLSSYKLLTFFLISFFYQILFPLDFSLAASNQNAVIILGIKNSQTDSYSPKPSSGNYIVVEGMGVSVGQCLITAGHVLVHNQKPASETFRKILIMSERGEVSELDPHTVRSTWSHIENSQTKHDIAIGRLSRYFSSFTELENIDFTSQPETLSPQQLYIHYYIKEPSQAKKSLDELFFLFGRKAQDLQQEWLAFHGSSDPYLRTFSRDPLHESALLTQNTHSSPPLDFGHSGTGIWSISRGDERPQLMGIFSSTLTLSATRDRKDTVIREAFAPLAANGPWLENAIEELDCFEFTKKAMGIEDYYNSSFAEEFNSTHPRKTLADISEYKTNPSKAKKIQIEREEIQASPRLNRKRRINPEESTTSFSPSEDLD